ncbi:hypothetical protein TREMEDRAFT_71512 [Tremella mesenterica DSM 1558]|uniref:uncharacterized protein n=1 Tax=Tremella mesenterica (strain ATCC 24925 / CBS 8224 / DSM 1558 / NBRC 9311 / NRRL Y-6157 / RJB 2259-6 / UBC 559-6) TaxID=578456 RepID=UPI0003F495E1|nr:uncharacterized protein TREMEDRAFT_71512 [Tremella mesenterica DSM 1558]EIW70072.1 hypothetical protein TREMEDRAFT_71512 [Tremella mesenterica DSM 1558]
MVIRACSRSCRIFHTLRICSGCSALVFGIVVIGGLTRLTESGLSITEWQPITGILPPIGEDQWEAEWEKYRVSPEGILYNSQIDMGEFKKIFYMEWGHRLAGRVLGIAFIVPTLYYLSRYRLPRSLQTKLLAIGLGIGFQGALGWYMVQSGLKPEIIEDKAPARVSQYRLAAHFGAALALYIGMLQTALGLRQDVKLQRQLDNIPKIMSMLKIPQVKRYKMLVHSSLGLVLLTAISGAFVAGLDAGLVYNEFPMMGEGLAPPLDELLDKRYSRREDGGDRWWRNMLENPVTAQFDHRVLATTTFGLLLSLPLMARRGTLSTILSKSTRRMAMLTAAAAITQVTLGITTLLYLVPVPLAASHQAGSVVLVTCLVGLASTLRRPSRALRALMTVRIVKPN